MIKVVQNLFVGSKDKRKKKEVYVEADGMSVEGTDMGATLLLFNGDDCVAAFSDWSYAVEVDSIVDLEEDE